MNWLPSLGFSLCFFFALPLVSPLNLDEEQASIASFMTFLAAVGLFVGLVSV